MKKLITILFLISVALFAYSGIDEMQKRDKGYAPVNGTEIVAGGGGNGGGNNGNGNGNGGSQNAPIDSHILFLASLVLVYGAIMIYYNKKQKNG